MDLADFFRYFPPARYSANPILCHGESGWKESQINDPLIVRDVQNRDKLIMFFTGMAAPTALGKFSIGLATADLSNPFVWTENPSNPVLTPSEKGHWDDWWVWATDCHIINNEYYLFYIGVNHRFSTYKIGLAVSPDGFHWTRMNKGKPILIPTKDEIHVAYPSLIFENNMWYMFYQWRDNKGPAGVRLATLAEGSAWNKWKKSKIPILSRGPPGSFDDKYIEGQQILKIGSKYVLLYHAFNGVHWTEGLAYNDTLNAPFIKYQKNPVFTRGPANSWDGMHVSTSYLYFINDHWYLFYQGTNSEGFYSYANWDIGMAELKDLN